MTEMRTMSQTLIGIFVVVALALGIGGVLAFGQLRLLTHADRAVIYFTGSVSGLAAGAPVTFRGVQVGRVSSVALHLTPDARVSRIPVVLELFPQRVVVDQPSGSAAELSLKDQVRNGLRGQLVTESLVTGQMAIDLEMLPGSPAPFFGRPGDPVEIPSVQSALERLEEEIPRLPLADLVDSAIAALRAATHLENTLDDRLPLLLDTAQKVVGGMQDLGPDLTKALATVAGQITRTLRDFDQLSTDLRDQVGRTGPDVQRLIAHADTAALDAHRVLAAAAQVTNADSDTRVSLDASLRDAAAAADHLRSFAHEVEQDPSLLLRGRHP
jgi:paraquat-inducible protein B